MKSTISGVFLAYRPNVWKDGSSHGFDVTLQNPDYPSEVLTFPTTLDFSEDALTSLAVYSDVSFNCRVLKDRKSPWLRRVVLSEVVSSSGRGGRHAS